MKGRRNVCTSTRSSIAEQISTQQGNPCLYSAPPSQAPRVQQYRSLSSVRKEVHPRVPKPLTPNPFPACSRWKTGRHCFFCLSSFLNSAIKHVQTVLETGQRAHIRSCVCSQPVSTRLGSLLAMLASHHVTNTATAYIPLVRLRSWATFLKRESTPRKLLQPSFLFQSRFHANGCNAQALTKNCADGNARGLKRLY